VFFLKLFKLAIKRNLSFQDYYAFQSYQAIRVVNFLMKSHLKISFKSALDFGCGYGAYSNGLSSYFKKVVAVDKVINKNAYTILENIEIFESDLFDFRYPHKFDLVFCASVIEHINPVHHERFIKNIKRHMSEKGFLYLSFPPFLSPTGGHVVAPFHYLPNTLAFRLVSFFKGRKVTSYETMFGNWGLFKLSINDIEILLQRSGFNIIKIRSRYMPGWYNKLFSRNNFFNWHCEIIAQKNSDTSDGTHFFI